MTRFKCQICEEWKNEEPCFGDPGTEYEGKKICEDCFFGDEPSATVIYSSDPEEPRYISSVQNQTEGAFRVRWHSTDGWRGYYEAESDSWVKIHDDCILSYSQDAEDLKSFDEAIKKVFEELGIEWAIVFARSSNPFSCGYELFVRDEDSERAKEVTEKLAEVYRDPRKFALTAWTGKDPDRCDKKDELFALMASIITKER